MYTRCLTPSTVPQSLCREFEDDSIRAVCAAITRHMQEAAVARQQGHPFWWKIHESCMQAIIVCSAQVSQVRQVGLVGLITIGRYVSVINQRIAFF